MLPELVLSEPVLPELVDPELVDPEFVPVPESVPELDELVPVVVETFCTVDGA